MEVGAALAAADTCEGGNRVPVAIAVTAKKESYVALRICLPGLYSSVMARERRGANYEQSYHRETGGNVRMTTVALCDN